MSRDWCATLPHSALVCLQFMIVFYLDHTHYLYPPFSSEEKGILISYQCWSVVRPSVCPSIYLSVMFLANVSPPKPLDVATSNCVAE